MRSTRLPRVALVITIALAALMLGAISSSAQWGNERTSGVGLSYAYGSDRDGFRLDASSGAFVYGVSYFNDRDDHGDAYGVELGLRADELLGGGGAIPLAVGGGYYRLDPDDAELDATDEFSFWAGAGDFSHSTKGLFYQYRYIFSGPLSGSEGCVGWAF